MTHRTADWNFQKKHKGKIASNAEKHQNDQWKNGTRALRQKTNHQQFAIEDRHKLKAQTYSKQNSFSQYEHISHKYDRFNHDTSKDTINVSFGQYNKLTDISINTTHKRQNGRTQAFELKVNKIDCIHDKIVNLLNMVNKDMKVPEEKVYYISSDKGSQNSKPEYIARPSEGKRKQFNRPRIVSAMNMRQKKIELTDSRKEQMFQKYGKNNYQQDDDHSYNPHHNHLQPQEEQQSNIRNQDQQQYEDASKSIFYRYTVDNSKDVQSVIEKKQKGKEIGKIVKEKRKYQYNQTLHEPQKEDIPKISPTSNNKWKNKYQLQEQSPVQALNLPNHKSPQKKQSIEPPLMQKRCGTLYAWTTALDQQSNKETKNKITQYCDQPQIQSKLIEDPQKNMNRIEKVNTPTGQLQRKILSVRIQKQQTVKMAQRLRNQVQIDGRMKQAREQFDRIPNPQKWTQLQSDLRRQGISLSLNEIKELIKCSPDEYNPFSSQIQCATKNESDLINLFCEAQQFWEREVCGCASLQVLKTEGFQVSDLDLNKKGHLHTEDLGSFVNLFTGRFYRNRDIALIYRRLQLVQNSKSKAGVSYSTFLRTLTT